MGHRCYSASTTEQTVPLAHTRNIGIIAHIDAGKTTTTERMLYYSGFTRRIGEVDEGSTVMDYLPAERTRGITITSAAITFTWTPSSSPTAAPAPHTINLIDTPGHADFTFEVERSIRVLDGAITILDGVAGVEAQTEKVWRQAHAYSIPRIIFVNKLDRVGARFGPTVKEVAAKLNGWPAVCQLPVYDPDTRGGEDVFRGVVDVVEKRVFLWDGGDGQKIELRDYEWLEEQRPELYEEAKAARVALVELLAEHDEELVEVFMELEDHALIPAAAIKASLRKSTLKGDGKIIPIFAGASFRNIGVQPLLDAVVDLLPSPLDRPPVAVSYNQGKHRGTLDVTDQSKVCALAFKVVNDPKRGAMVFVRVYSGTLTRAHNLFNTNLGVKERATRLVRMYADEAVDIAAIPTGHIGVIIGLKHARTGDTLVSETTGPSTHKSKQKNSKTPQLATDTLQLRPIAVPPPVFFAAIEPNSLSDQKHLDEALAMLLREDPSLHISIDEDSGQTLISGMGELHLEIARDRLVGDFKANAEMGRILISYRETIAAASQPVRTVFDREIAGKRAAAACTVSVEPLDPTSTTATTDDGNTITITITTPQITDPATGESTDTRLPKWLTTSELETALQNGASAALGRGPALGFPVRGIAAHVSVDVSTDVLGPESTLAAFSSAARVATTAALKEAAGGESVLMEPVMDVVVTCEEKDLGKVVGDISGARGGHVLELGGLDAEADAEAAGGEVEREVDLMRVYAPGVKRSVESRDEGGRKRSVRARVPLKEMVGYLKHLRGITAGRGTFVMSLEGWERMNGNRVREVVAEVRGG
ncbi:P-loop containing nucleoside triphosphate hydrolase protein [Morchella conica CCBAS932]|uniref:Ribosome-releasing factor 2, mitochondrial n=1 Tax=Morchella conica CCBAS932 TaxID=1392247 RepID=A0A3N4KIK9_9PEZI|nr:P-loop containing nucleoside triphosphate hydrolase protein [Morchella conica CCBAS932]